MRTADYGAKSPRIGSSNLTPSNPRNVRPTAVAYLRFELIFRIDVNILPLLRKGFELWFVKSAGRNARHTRPSPYTAV